MWLVEGVVKQASMSDKVHVCAIFAISFLLGDLCTSFWGDLFYNPTMGTYIIIFFAVACVCVCV